MQFRQDNTAGFSDAELDRMNDEFHHELALTIERLPHGALGADDDLIAQITQSVAEAVLRRHGAA